MGSCCGKVKNIPTFSFKDCLKEIKCVSNCCEKKETITIIDEHSKRHHHHHNPRPNHHRHNHDHHRRRHRRHNHDRIITLSSSLWLASS